MLWRNKLLAVCANFLFACLGYFLSECTFLEFRQLAYFFCIVLILVSNLLLHIVHCGAIHSSGYLCQASKGPLAIGKEQQHTKAIVTALWPSLLSPFYTLLSSLVVSDEFHFD